MPSSQNLNLRQSRPSRRLCGSSPFKPQSHRVSAFEVYVDGAFSEATKAMGAGWVIYDSSGKIYREESSVYQKEYGDSFMAEAMALLGGLRGLPRGADATIYTDNEPLIGVLSGACQTGKKYARLFSDLDDAIERLGTLDFRNIQGHAGIRGNEKAHELANAALKKLPGKVVGVLDTSASSPSRS
jgi:ribonuclease HI